MSPPLPAPPIRCPIHRLSPLVAVPPALVHEPNKTILHRPLHHSLHMPSNWFGHYPSHVNRTTEQLNPWNPYNRYMFYSNTSYAAYQTRAYGERPPNDVWSNDMLLSNERFFTEQQVRPPRPNERPLSTSPPPIAPFSPQSVVAVDPSHVLNQTEHDDSYACVDVPYACETLPVVISSDEDGDVQSMPASCRSRRSEKRRRSGDSPTSETNGNCRREIGMNSAKMVCRQYGDAHQQHAPQDDLMPLALVSPSRRRDRIPINLSGKQNKKRKKRKKHSSAPI